MGDCVLGLLIVLLIIIVIMSVGGCCAYKNEIETFTAKKGQQIKTMYQEWKTDLDQMKLNNQIGEPNGVLSFNPDATTCNTEKNLLVQPNVAFKPHPFGENGCTYIQKRYPQQ